MKQKNERMIEYPFIIHADPLKEETAFPTHTHGLTKVGMPEFIMDPFAFGPEGNGTCINLAYDFFKKPHNADKLTAILNGQTIKLKGGQLSPKYLKNETYTYCFREVSPDFEAVRQAYVLPGPGVEPAMRFIQIYVDGDNFALMDDYYRNGVRW
jgi:hypothetical protein